VPIDDVACTVRGLRPEVPLTNRREAGRDRVDVSVQLRSTYLADKTEQLLPRDPARRYETIEWLMFQMAGIGPIFGQVGFFNKFGGKAWEDKRPLERCVAESKHLFGVLQRQLAGRAWIMGDEYTIADIATFPWVRNLIRLLRRRRARRHP
jgi:glutathione S-transferase